MADDSVSHDANPGNKRPRMAAESSHAGSAGKGIAKVATEWALPKIADVHTTLAKQAKQLGKSILSGQSAVAHMQELQAAGKVPSSLRLKLPQPGRSTSPATHS